MVEQSVAAKMPKARRKDDISEKDEFHLPQIVSARLIDLRETQCAKRVTHPVLILLSQKKKSSDS